MQYVFTDVICERSLTITTTSIVKILSRQSMADYCSPGTLMSVHHSLPPIDDIHKLHIIFF